MHLAALLLSTSVVSLACTFSNSIQQCASIITELSIYNRGSYSFIGANLCRKGIID